MFDDTFKRLTYPLKAHFKLIQLQFDCGINLEQIKCQEIYSYLILLSIILDVKLIKLPLAFCTWLINKLL